MDPVTAPSGEQHEISAGGYRAVVTEGGAALRVLEHEGRPLVDGFGLDEMSSGGRGQLLVPWPNRIRDGQYTVGDRALQLPLTEPSRHNASHGLVRWAAWSLAERTGDSVTLRHRLLAQSGYPWTLDLEVTYEVGPGGLRVTQRATNRAGDPAPYAQGAHPYLTVGQGAGQGPCDDWELELPASTRLLADPERKLPTGREPVEGTPYDFRTPRTIGDTVLDHAFTDLRRDEVDGAEPTVVVALRDPRSGAGVALWMDGSYGWVMVYTGDDNAPGTRRRSVAVEPMTAPADAFRTGEDVVALAPGATFAASWGIRSLT